MSNYYINYSLSTAKYFVQPDNSSMKSQNVNQLFMFFCTKYELCLTYIPWSFTSFVLCDGTRYVKIKLSPNFIGHASFHIPVCLYLFGK